ncbi:uncharacterized protein LACBIDRAFT_305349 [Laccaria bicolor S238N-H82]|uniref:Predicted protein n=1 Tax=Laccaria bicolor (strain S238N-H82 / ATCC MYA-4686) TaxID=486041 RepID=B0CU07_LACBS|nr:uncharacterized protein LACBIDRAFT_305349 [Laccaria bicolor S238N-H82]EDR14007.1 predicted protein [Laccaria bicolor S238N-H82]|eukprot:XP_001874566.1 predicted protein [Laccaria bicolor S238N-H82]
MTFNGSHVNLCVDSALSAPCRVYSKELIILSYKTAGSRQTRCISTFSKSGHSFLIES